MTPGCKLPLLLLLLVAPGAASAREGLFARFSLGPGVAAETAPVQGMGLVLGGKDHAIGYGITERFAVQVADFGGLVRKKGGAYDYLNLDGLGLGGTVFLPRGTLVSLSAGYGQVAFARNWWEATGADKDEGVAAAASVRKEWLFAKRWSLGAGAVATFFRTFSADYTFFTLSLAGSVTFYLTPE
jgi:hypothetical protein